MCHGSSRCFSNVGTWYLAQLSLRVKALKRQVDEAEEEIERLDGLRKKAQRELEEQHEVNEQLQARIKALEKDSWYGLLFCSLIHWDSRAGKEWALLSKRRSISKMRIHSHSFLARSQYDYLLVSHSPFPQIS